jgi:hypothetical protein
MTSQTVIAIAFGGLIIWSLIRRVRRNIGKQKLSPARAIRSIIILSVISILIGSQSLQNPNALLGFGGGILAGALLGLLGLRLTKFETNAEGHFYIPNTHIGIALSLLFVGRIIYRLIPRNSADAAQNHPQLFQSPLTLVIFGLTVGYYIVYQIGLFIHSRDKNLSAQKNLPPDSNLDSSRDRS